MHAAFSIDEPALRHPRDLELARERRRPNRFDTAHAPTPKGRVESAICAPRHDVFPDRHGDDAHEIATPRSRARGSRLTPSHAPGSSIGKHRGACGSIILRTIGAGPSP